MAVKNQKQEEAKFKSREAADLILRAIAVVSIVGTSIVLPNFPIVLGAIVSLVKEFKGGKRIENYKIKHALKTLQKRNIIEIEEIDGKVTVHILDHGRSILMKYSMKQLLEYKKKAKKWDGKWRVILFDVAEKERRKRDFLRRTIKWMGFFPYQKSVFVFPYECEKEVMYLKNMLEGKYDIKYLIAEKIDDERRLKIFFQLS